jgi:uncharacterized protein DUF4019
MGLTMKTSSLIVSAVMLAATVLAASREEARARAEAWLALVDSQRYGQSWTESSSLFRSRVTQQRWTGMARQARESVGDVISRTLLTVTFAKSLPGAPDGDYAVLRFQTSFTRKAQAVETVTLMMDAGVLRSAGYFIK